MPGAGSEFDYYTRSLFAKNNSQATQNNGLLADRVLNGSISGLPLEGPCLMAALQGIAESYAGKNLTAEQKLSSIASLIKDGNMLSDFEVQSSEAVIRDALGRLGVDTSDLQITVSKPGDDNYSDTKKNATASILSAHFLSGSGTHYQEGDAQGRFRWDPISGANNGGRKPMGDEHTRYIWIRKRSETDE